MSVPTCPKCGQDHNGAVDSRGFATCRKCANCWQLHKLTAPEQPPITSKPMRKLPNWGVSDEYAPVESTDQPRTEPLSVRDPSSSHQALEASPSASGPRRAISPSAPSKPGPSRRPSSEELDVPADFDSQLFERAERDAQLDRSVQETVSAPNPIATPSTEDTGTCPVCGHRFSPIRKDDHQRCPQCSIVFSIKSGDPVDAYRDDEDGGGDDTDDIIGATIRGCFVDRKLGEGGMGTVFHARQLSLDRSVAIKVMPSELTRNKNFIQRFEREAKSLARINHPNILHIYDFGEDHEHGIYFMIIEYVDGKDLGEILRARESISQAEALDIMRQAMQALEMASAKGVIHRDIKPDNLMIAKDGTCKVSDFGLAKGYGDFTEVTTAGVRVGTPAFMSPEQCDGGDIDARSDVYSLGCTMYLAMTGHLPFNGDSPFSIMLKHKTEPIPSLRKYRADAHPGVDALIQRMLAKRPDERCIEIHELINEIQDLQVELAGNASPQGRKTTGDRPRSVEESGAVRLLPDVDPPPREVPPVVASAPARALPKADNDDDNPNIGFALRRDLGEDDIGSGFGRALPDFVKNGPDSEPISPSTIVPASASMPPPPIPAAPAPVLLDDNPPALPAVTSVPTKDPARSSQSAARSSNRSVGPDPAVSRSSSRLRSINASSGENKRPPSVTSSATIHVQQGDNALQDGRPSEAIRQYQEAQRRRPSKEIGGKLADARKAQRHGDAASIEQRGDEAARLGRYDDAIDDWMRASQQYSQVARREDLLRKVAKAQRAKQSRRLTRVFFGLILIVVVLGVNAYLWTPDLHNKWIEYERTQANTLGNPVERRAALQHILQKHQPFAWYKTCFSKSYELNIAAVEADIRAISAAVEPTGPNEIAIAEAKVIATLQADVGNDKMPWSTVIDRGEKTLTGLRMPENRDTVTAILGSARDHVASIEAEVAAIDVLRAQGRHGEAVQRVEAFVESYPRAGSNIHLPVVGRLTLESTEPLKDAVVMIDGVRLIDSTTVFCRDQGKPVLIEISAPGYLSERRTVPAGAGEAIVVVAMQPGLRWTSEIKPGKKWWRLESINGFVMAVGPLAVTRIDHVNGTIGQVFDRRSIPVAPSLPNPDWTFYDLDGEQPLLATSDGIVARVQLSEKGQWEYREIVRKGSTAVLAWLERELTFQPGRKVQVMIDVSQRGAALTVADGPTEMWRVSNLEVKLSRPFVSSLGDRILMVDDANLRVFEEDGAQAHSYSFIGNRTAPVTTMNDGRVLVVPTTEGVNLIHVGGQPHYVRAIKNPPLDSAGSLAVGVANDGLVTGDALGQVRAYKCVDGVVSPLWQTAVPELRKASGPISVAAETVIVVDDQHVIHVFERSTGAIIRSYNHPTSIVVPPLAVGDQLIVLDVLGILTSYQLAK